MLNPALTYREEALAAVVEKAMSGGRDGVVHLNSTPAMPRTEAEIVNKLGLHARAAAKLTRSRRVSPPRCGCCATVGA